MFCKLLLNFEPDFSCCGMAPKLCTVEAPLLQAPEHLSVHEHLLPAAGGASGVAESLVACAKEKKADLLVLGSRGMGATKRTLMSMVGLGSVSDYCVHNAPCPVAVVRAEGDAAATAAAVPTAAERKARRRAPRRGGEGHKVLVSIDDSQLAKKALAWALHHCMDELHLVCVALPIPYPIVHEDAVEAAPLQSEEAEEATAESLRYAREVKAWEGRLRGSSGGPGSPGAAHAGGAAAVAAVAPHDPPSHHNGASWRPSLSDIDKSRIFFKALYPEGGASDVGESIVHYAKANKVDLLVVGARGMGAIKRAVMSFVGLGSVSDYCVHNSACPVVIVKE
eukprot:scaffold5.g632.t1